MIKYSTDLRAYHVFIVFCTEMQKYIQLHTKSSHTTTTHTHLGSFGVVKFCSLRGEGRTGWEG